jgi:hypothetical protein
VRRPVVQLSFVAATRTIRREAITRGLTMQVRYRGLGRAVAAVVAACALAGCAGVPPAGTPEYAAWVRQKQEESAAIERVGRLGDSLGAFRQNTP